MSGVKKHLRRSPHHWRNQQSVPSCVWLLAINLSRKVSLLSFQALHLSSYAWCRAARTAIYATHVQHLHAFSTKRGFCWKMFLHNILSTRCFRLSFYYSYMLWPYFMAAFHLFRKPLWRVVSTILVPLQSFDSEQVLISSTGPSSPTLLHECKLEYCRRFCC